jgi:hypothetical protein
MGAGIVCPELEDYGIVGIVGIVVSVVPRAEDRCTTPSTEHRTPNTEHRTSHSAATRQRDCRWEVRQTRRNGVFAVCRTAEAECADRPSLAEAAITGQGRHRAPATAEWADTLFSVRLRPRGLCAVRGPVPTPPPGPPLRRRPAACGLSPANVGLSAHSHSSVQPTACGLSSANVGPEACDLRRAA